MKTTKQLIGIVAMCMVSFSFTATTFASGYYHHKSSSHYQYKYHGGIEIQEHFDYIGPSIKSIEANGRTVFYIDEGPKNGIPVVVAWGAGTSIRGLSLVDFVKSTRDQLGLRIISVEQNGIGLSILDKNLGLTDYAKDVEAVLGHLGVNRFSLFGASMSGVLIAAIAERNPNRIRSLHLSALFSGPIFSNGLPIDLDSYVCILPLSGDGRVLGDLETSGQYFAFSPQQWWGFDSTLPSNVPGFAESSYEDALFTFLVNAQGNDVVDVVPGLGFDPLPPDPDPADPGENVAQQFVVQCSGIDNNDLATIKAPVFIYHGDADPEVSIAHIDVWEAALPNAKRIVKRIYPGEEHDSYRLHFEQIYADIKFKRGNKIVVCDRSKNKSLIMNNEAANKILYKGGTLGICAWDR